MKVIVNGDVRTYKVECPHCDSLLKYNKNDVQSKEETQQWYLPEYKKGGLFRSANLQWGYKPVVSELTYIVCPVCGERIVLESEYPK